MPGFHLPYLAGAADGLFADHGLDVEILDPAAGAENVRRVARAEAEFCLTSVLHYLTARAHDGLLAARFVAVVGQRSPMAGLVAAGSRMYAPADLGGRRVGGPEGGRLLTEYCASLARRGVAEPAVIFCEYGQAPAALGRGDVDVVPDFADLLPRVRRQSGIDVRAVRVGVDVYSSGLVAGDHVSQGLAVRMRDAVAAAVERQRQVPETGLEALRERYAGVDPGEALEGWRLAEASVFTGVPVGTMHGERWQATVDHYAAGHGLSIPDATTAYRPELATDGEDAVREAENTRPTISARTESYGGTN